MLEVTERKTFLSSAGIRPGKSRKRKTCKEKRRNNGSKKDKI